MQYNTIRPALPKTNSLNIRVSDDLKAKLKVEADQLGVKPSELARAILENHFERRYSK